MSEVMSMAESIGGVRDFVEETLASLKDGIEGAENSDIKGLIARLESVRATIVRNEKKIWLRTKKGRDMLSEANKAAGRMRSALDPPFNFEDLRRTLDKVEAHARAIDEETRKRSMVVT